MPPLAFVHPKPRTDLRSGHCRRDWGCWYKRTMEPKHLNGSLAQFSLVTQRTAKGSLTTSWVIFLSIPSKRSTSKALPTLFPAKSSRIEPT